jgi:hypothetical protein
MYPEAKALVIIDDEKCTPVRSAQHGVVIL